MAFTTFNPTDTGTGVTLSNGNLTAAGNPPTGDSGSRAADFQSSGKYYFEVTVNTAGGTDTGVGLSIPGEAFSALAGGPTGGVICYNSGNVWVSGARKAVLASGLAAGMTVCIAVDFGNAAIWFRENGGTWNNSGTADPASNAGGISLSSLVPANSLAPAVTIGSGASARFTANFGASAFAQTVPTGFTAGWPTSTAATNARASQLDLEALSGSSGNARASQLDLEALSGSSGNARASQLALEVLALNLPLTNARASQLDLEALSGSSGNARASQVLLEVLALNLEPPPVPLIFPQLKGLSWNYVKRQKWATNVGSHASGREIRIALWQFPLWEWDLSWDYLPDQQANGTTLSDLQELMGFCGAVLGSQATFLYQDPDDNYITNQALGTGDGKTTIFPLFRNFGAAGMGGQWNTGAFSEPVGQANLGASMNVYLNGVLQNNSTYTVQTTPLLGNTITFNAAPAAGAAITADFGYYFACRLKDDATEFEKFATKRWEQKKLTLVSTRS